MNLTIAGKHIDIGEALRAHVETHMSEVAAKYFGDPVESHVVFSHEGTLYRTRNTVHVGKNIAMDSQGEDADIYASFNQAAEHLKKRLRRQKRKLRDHQ
ncbi:MAG: ribosome-associated translation inhibitor RaiA [Alphaproteobacteria bacterium]|nr:ribosome-associated translation inhibitor RaiA [Alphaproteobacteria bacterium]